MSTYFVESSRPTSVRNALASLAVEPRDKVNDIANRIDAQQEWVFFLQASVNNNTTNRADGWHALHKKTWIT